jgi:CheY-like chemotaxis protein
MKRILLCTADESFSRSLARLLRAAAYDVVAADGPGSLAHIERDAFDAVVTDLRMPDADGFAILDAVRAKAPQTPVIVLSGSAQIQDAMCAMRLGACDFLVKPVDVKSLEKALGRALKTARPPTPNVGPDAVAWGNRTASTPTGTTDLHARLKSVEDRMVADALVRTRGNKNRAAALLGLDRPSLLEKLRRKQMENQPPDHTSATACDKIASLSHTLFLLPRIIPEQVAEERIEAARVSNASELDLHGLGLTRLPPSIGQLAKLQSLNVFRNQLSALPNAIGNLSQLRFLYISENRLTALPEAIGRLSQLQFLSASENRLTALPEAIGRLSQLHHLNLCNNRLTALPKSLRRLAGLEKLFLQENPDLGFPPKVLGPPLHCLPWGDARPANPTSILDYYFKTPVSGNRWPHLFRGLFRANVKKLKAKGDVEELFQIAIDNGNYSNRLAVQAIKELGHQAVVPLMSCVKAYYRINANLSFEDIATAFSGVGAAIVVPLIRLLEQSNGDIAAIVALGKLKDPRAVPILCALFKMGNPLISTQVATALAAIANEEAVAALMQELEGDYFIARADAVYALGIIGDQSFIPAITKACSDPHERVREAAGKALHQITTRSP